MKSYNLQYYVDKLKNGEKFSLARYGDGEMYCMWGKKGQNSNGCRYSPELREALLDSMKHKDDPTFIYGMQRVLPRDRERFEKEYPDIEFYDTEIFSEAVANGELYPLIEQLRKLKVGIVSNIKIIGVVGVRKGLNLNTCNCSEVLKNNAYNFKDQVIKDILEAERTNVLKPDVWLFACGMAANAFIGELHGKVSATLLDIGHIFDPFVGDMSRCDLEGKTLEDIEKNLHEKTK